MNNFNALQSANTVLIQHFARSYLAASICDNPVVLEGASIETRCIANRTNVPKAAVTTSHYVQHPELGFVLQCRAVWFAGRLLMPVTTHVVIEWIGDQGGHESTAAIVAANEWLQAVTP